MHSHGFICIDDRNRTRSNRIIPEYGMPDVEMEKANLDRCLAS